jgi:hypothetical protein
MMDRRTFGRIRALVLAVVVPVGAVCAPFLHAHVDEDHHHATSVHAHVTSHVSSHGSTHDAHETPELEADGGHDRAIYLELFVAVQTTPLATPDLPVASFTLTASSERSPRTPVLVSHGHDPPFDDALDSRPPPLSLS